MRGSESGMFVCSTVFVELLNDMKVVDERNRDFVLLLSFVLSLLNYLKEGFLIV